jgi:hypothetical protein
MIRDFTKSAMSLSWALSLLGLKQAVNLVRPGQQQGGGDLFAPMTQVAVDQLDDSMKGIYRSGDSLQSRAVDMAFAMMNPTSWLNPNQWMRPFSNGCGQQRATYRAGNRDFTQNGGCGQDAGYGQSANGFTQAAAGMGQAVSQAAAGFTQAVGQATADVAQAVTGSRGQAPGTRDVPLSNDSAAASWGPMPSDF